jgi:hypothetical protein
VQGLISSFGGAQGRIWSFGGDLWRHYECGRVVEFNIEAFGPCKCSIIVNVLIYSSKGADLSD